MFVDQEAMRLDGENELVKKAKNPFVLSQPPDEEKQVADLVKAMQPKPEPEESESKGEKKKKAPTRYTIELNAK